MDMGLSGVSLSKPEGKPTPVSDTMNSEPEQVNSDVYDPVIESPPTVETASVKFIKYI